MEEKKYLRFGQKLAYGSGDFASNFCYTFVTSFVLIYLTNSVGLNSAIIGSLMMASRLLDGTADVFFGTFIDKTHSKMGKARPWMFWSTFPLAICEVLLFMTPNMSQNLQYIYFFIVYTLLNAVFYTANNIAYATLCALITRNKTERVQLGVFRFIFALLASIIIASITSGMVSSFGGGAEGWRMVAFIYSGILIIVNTISVLGVKELPEYESSENTSEQKMTLGKSLKYLFHNKYFFVIVGIYIATFTMLGLTTGSGIYYMTYVLGNASMLGLFSFVTVLPMIFGLAATPALVEKWGMYKVNLVTMTFALFFSVVFIFVGLSKNIPAMLAVTALRSLFMSPMTGSLNALIAEASGYSFRKYNVHIDGTMYSCSTVGIKVGGGLGSAICGWLLAAGGYNGKAAVQSATALNAISSMYVILPVIFFVVELILLFFLDVEKANKILDETKSSSEQNV